MVLVAALMVLALLSILSVAAIATSTLEVKIAAHDRDAKQAFYLCEAALEKAKYEIVKGWGKGIGGAGTFTFDASTLPAVVQTWWTSNLWQNFTLVDRVGGRYQVTADDPASHGLTLDTSAQPQDGRASLFYASSGPLTVAGEPAGGNDLTVPGAAWAANQWRGHYLVELGTNAVFDVVSNTTDALTLSTPPSSPGLSLYELQAWRAAGSSLTLPPGIPNANWDASAFGSNLWYVRDSSDNVFGIASAAGATYDRVVLSLTGNPVNGPFQLTTNPWLVGTTFPVTWDAKPAASGFPASIDYGTVSVTRTETTPGHFVLQAQSTSTGTLDVKRIESSVRLGRNGSVAVNNWEEAAL
jgi:type II secretory pathway pseudopilin PulG